MGSQANYLQDILQAEFCPPLDSALIAALVADYVYDGSARNQSVDELKVLRLTLSSLANEARKTEMISEPLDSPDDNPTSSAQDTSSISQQDVFSNDAITLSTNTSFFTDGSHVVDQSFSSPLGFLEAAFPQLPSSRLRSALSSFGDVEPEEIDMEAIVERVLSSELIRELEERGMSALDNADATAEYVEPWEMVQHRKSPISKSSTKRDKRAATFTFGDVRQKQHQRPTNGSASAPRKFAPLATVSPWTQVESIATQLATLIPSHPVSYFMSQFHSPSFDTPAQALRAALAQVSSSKGAKDEVEDTAIIFNLFDMITSNPDTSALTLAQREQLMSDIRLAVCASADPQGALDVLSVLQTLDSDITSGNYQWGVYHSPATSAPTSPKPAAKQPRSSQLPQGPPDPPPPPGVYPTSNNRTATGSWTIVPTRKANRTNLHPHADFIPAYNTTRKGKIRGTGNGLGKGGKGDVGELGSFSPERRAAVLMKKSAELYLEAGRAWQSGNVKSRGGEVALFYAEKARAIRGEAFEAKLEAAYERVAKTRKTSSGAIQIDLHKTTVVEAIQIVNTMLVDDCPSPAKPLEIITGRGIHSSNGVGVLQPAIKRTLLQDGWNVGTWEGGLIVRGRKVMA